MKKKLLSLLLVACMILPMIPTMPLGIFAAEAVGAANATDFVKSKTYDFGDVPAYSWYTIANENYDYASDGLAKGTGYNDYIAKFNALFGSTETYDDMEKTDTVTFLDGYVTRENLGASSVYDAEKFNSGKNNRTDLGVNSPAYSDDPNADPRDWLGGKYVFSYTLDPRKEEGYTGSQNIPKMIILAGTQADEKSSCFALYYIIQELLYRTDDPQINYLRNNAVLIIVPALTPYNMDNYTYWNANGVNINRNYDTFWKHVDNTTSQTSYGGEEPFDQAEARMMRKIIAENRDAFYMADCHTCTSGVLPAGDYEHLNWHALPKSYDSYISKLETAAETQIANVRENFKRFDCGYTDEDTVGLITYTTSATSPSYAISQGILSTTMEGFCGFPGDNKVTGLYTPEVKQAYIELLVNWLMTVVREYATDEEGESDTVTSSFYPMSENYPTVTNLPIDFLGHYDSTDISNAAQTTLKSLYGAGVNQIVYNGGWEMGYLPVTLATTSDGSVVTSVSKAWGDFAAYGNVAVVPNSTSGKPTLYLSYNNDPFTGRSGMQMGVNYVWLAGFQGIDSTYTYNADPTVRYTAEYSGKINIDISDLTFTSETGVLVVLKNGKEIGRVEAGVKNATYYIANGTWAVYDSEPQKMQKTITVSVAAGDKIDFVYDADARVLYSDLWGQMVGESGSGIDKNKSANTKNLMSDRIKYGITNYRFDISYVRSTETVTASYAGVTTDSAITVSRPTTMMPFFTWYKDGEPIASGKSISGASYATINQALIDAGYISPKATYAEALAQYKDYLREIATVVDIAGDFRVGAMESATASTSTGTNFSTINKYALLAQSNIYLGTGSSTYKTAVGADYWYVSANYFEYQLELYCLGADLVAPTSGTCAANFKLPYSSAVSTAAIVPHPSSDGRIPAGSSRPVADTTATYEGIMLCPHNSGRKAAVAYIVPAGVAGEATLKVDDLYYGQHNNAFKWALIVNGEIVVNYTDYNPATQTVDDINNVLKTKQITVKGGDTIAFAISRTGSGAIWVSPALSVTVEQTAAVVYTGTSSEITLNRPTTMIPFFTWYNGTTAITSGSLANATKATINEALLAKNGGPLTGNEDYATALKIYKQYLRDLARSITANNGWMVGAMEGDKPTSVGANFNHINSYSFISQANIYCGTKGDQYSKSVSTYQLYVTENYFNDQLNTYCQGDSLMQPTSGTSVSNYVFNTAYADLAVTNVPHPTSAGSIMPAAQVRTPDETGAYEGLILAPHSAGSNRTGAIAYRVPTGKGGTVTLQVENFYFGSDKKATYNNTFSWALYLNKQLVIDFTACTPTAEGAIDEINKLLAKNPLTVKEGDLIQFAVRRTGSAVWISPSFSLTGLAEQGGGLRRVQYYKNGVELANTFVPVDSDLAAVLKKLRLDNATVGANGYTVNGKYYATEAELPTVGASNLVIVDGITQNSLSIGSAYAVNVYLPQDAKALSAGVLVDGKAIAGVKQSNNTWRITLDPVVAKDLLTTETVYTPYYTYTGGTLTVPASIKVKAADLLAAYVASGDAKVSALAQATVDYANTAAACFDGATLSEETKATLKETDAALAALTANKAYAPKAEDAYLFYASTVALGDTVNFVLAITAGTGDLADLDACTVAVSGKNVSGKFSEFIDTTVNGKAAKMILIKGVPATQIGESLTFTVMQGETAVSSALTYSVNAYCARTFNGGESIEQYAVRALYRLGVAAAPLLTVEKNTLTTEQMQELVDFVVEVEEGRDPVILHLTDTQIIDAAQLREGDTSLGAALKELYATDQMEACCFSYVRETIEATKPDLIIITGDLVYGKFDDAGTSFEALVQFMDSFDIPWAPVFGNHDNESAKGADWQCALLENAENCLFLQRKLTGNGNYSVGIAQGGELLRVFFMLDSNGCGGASEASLANGHTVNNKTGFDANQIAWYTDAAIAIRTQSPATKLSFAFHIQPASFANAYAGYGFTNSGTSENGISIDFAEDQKDGDFGYLGADLKSSWDSKGNVIGRLIALGVDSIFVGHEHCNSASVVYGGVRYQYGQKSSIYDRFNGVLEDNTIKGTYGTHGTPLIGGTVVPLSAETGEITSPYIYYCENAGGELDWSAIEDKYNEKA